MTKVAHVAVLEDGTVPKGLTPIAAAQAIAQQSKWHANAVSGELQRVEQQYLPTALAATRRAALQDRAQRAIAYTRDTTEYVRTLQSAIEARERMLGHYRHAIGQAESNHATSARDLQKAINAVVAAGPFALVAAAVAGVAVAYNDLNRNISAGAADVLKHQQSWKDSAATLDLYIDVLNQNRAVLADEMRQLEQGGGLFGTNSNRRQ